MRAIHWRKVLLFALSLFLFILSVYLVKSGASALAPLVRERLAVRGLGRALGFGWLATYLVLSGSPVAATALALFDAGALDRLGAFGMIAGSRLGASFIVLTLGFVYSLRGHDRQRSLAMGLLSLVVTAATQLPALALGAGLLQSRLLDQLSLEMPGGAFSAFGLPFDLLTGAAEALLPRWAVFLLGFGVLWFSLNLIDRALPDMRLKESAFSGMSLLLYRPAVTFALGLAITSLTMSVSVSLSVLVPLSARGYIRRENVVPYIMGANVTTFLDTLAVAALLDNPQAFTIVLAHMLSGLIVSTVLLGLFYQPYQRAVLDLVDAIGRSRRNLAVFVCVLMGVPLALLVWG